MDAAYGAYAAAENNTFNNTFNNSNNTANNNANNHVRDYAKILRASRFAARSAKNVDLDQGCRGSPPGQAKVVMTGTLGPPGRSKTMQNLVF